MSPARVTTGTLAAVSLRFARGQWTFLFSAAPIRFPGGMGSPLNPLAIF